MKFHFAWLAALGFSFAAAAQEPEVQSAELPRIPATPPEKAVSTFKVRDGFRIELAASEPLVADPITMAFDADSRLYVVEMRDYSERREESLGRVRLLEDTNGDGQFDRSSIFAEGLAWPTAIFPWDGGVFVGATPSIFYFKDADGDGRAEIKKEVFAGFGSSSSRPNVQQLFNSLNWSLDNRIHGANGGNSGVISQRDGSKLNLGGYDFSFDPRSLEIRLESGGGQYGLSFDSHGHKFVCSNSSHIRQVMYEARYLTSELSYNLPSAAVDIPADGGAAEVFRLSPDEPWRVMRTKWRVAGMVGGPIEGGGRPSGYFTGATGVTIYKGDAYGPEFANNGFIGDAGGNLVHRKRLAGDGLPYQAVRPEDERKIEFVASSDNWFRPVHFANAPDGTLYIADMYREVIEHPWSLPPNIKKHLDLNSGNEMGRIYRVLPTNFKQPKLPKLSKAASAELAALLGHSNGWHRETAARLIYERQDNLVIPQLKRMVESSASVFGRLHALYALQGLRALTIEEIERGIADKSSMVRVHAVRLSENFIKGGQAATLLQKLGPLAQDESREVRYQLAFTLTKFPADQVAGFLSALLERESSGWERHAVLASASRAPFEIYAQKVSDAPLKSRLALAELIGSRNSEEEVKAFIAMQKEAPAEDAIKMASALQGGLNKRGASLQSAAYRKDGEAFVVKAVEFLSSDTSAVDLKIAALGLAAEQENFVQVAREWLEKKDVGNNPLALPIMQRLASKPGVASRELILARWPQVSTASKAQILQTWLSRASEWEGILQAVQKGQISRSEFSTSQVESLRKASNEQTRALAMEIFGKGSPAPRVEIVNKYLDAARLKGSAAKGRVILETRCLICHQLEGKGQTLGPPLETVRAAGRQTLLVNILDPNREVSPRYAAYEALTKEGESYSGILASENAKSITLQLPGGIAQEISRDQLKSLQPTGKSLMPEQLEEGLSSQDLADLLEAIVEGQR